VELALRPLRGLPAWLGPGIVRWLLRLVSMEEVPAADQHGLVIPTRSWFRRDRWRHPRVDPERWSLQIDGVAAPRTFTLAELRALPQTELLCVMECAGNGNDKMGSAGLVAQGRFRGPSFAALLEACGGPGAATHFACHGLDPIPFLRPGYHYGLSAEELTRAGAIIALDMNGEPLPRSRGFPARLVVPGIYSMSHVKWLGRIEGKTRAHRGFWNRWVFVNRRRTASGWAREEARWIGLKSAITRCRRGGAEWELSGWAWGGSHAITRVEVTTDGGATWADAEVTTPARHLAGDPAPPRLESAWSTFAFRWSARPGRHRIASRAYAADGSVQPLRAPADVRGPFDVVCVKWREVDVP
jgi:DMSO/TMAO reductase YedYZ molybdopterin-dependent catalytic subunit